MNNIDNNSNNDNFEVCDEFSTELPDISVMSNISLIKKDILEGKIYLITTYWTYPFGGGEEFMYDTMEWASKLGMKSYWIAFTDSRNKQFETFSIIKHEYGTIMHIPGGFNVETLSNWLYIIKPDIVHHQGRFRDKFFLATEDLRIEFLTGFHFWLGGINMNESKGNILMIENAQYHKEDPEFALLKKKERCNFYCASKFVQECFNVITKTFIPDIIYPSSSIVRYKLDADNDPWYSKYVVMINIHKNKGGSIFFHLLKSCLNIHFLCVQTEHDSEELDELIKDIIESRNKNKNCADCVFMTRTTDVKEIYKKCKIMLCPSFVDETFCRVVNESMMNAIPVLTTHRGNIKYLVGDTTPILDVDSPKGWEDAINNIYYDENAYRIMSKKMLEKYSESSEEKAKIQFENIIRNTVKKSKNYSIGIFTPWCDQGLGIQSRNYYKILKTSGIYNIAIFALKPYNAINCEALQKNKNEWIADNIYYSPNSREDVTDLEIIEFCRNYNIGKMIIPETCWNRIFQIAKLLRELDVKSYAVPNIEIVRKDEIYKHNYFYKILANNYLCSRVFSVLDVEAKYIGYGIEGIELKEKVFLPDADNNNIVKFLFIGGMNAFSRKHVLDVCSGFSMAYKQNNNLRLTITIQMTNSLEESSKNEITHYINHPGINIIQSHISYKEILDLYYTHHIGIQVSKHEGLGLGFYEALATGTPVLTLKTPPHNEIILDEVNGWTIDCYHKKMTDNKDPLFGSAYFHPKVIADKFVELANIIKIKNVIDTLKIDLKTRLSLETFSTRFLNEIN